jgi:transcriptional regulator of aroF, aroG, tyrA and aromatic amino acid transport
LLGHGWPGNVRELKNVIERAAILCDSDAIDTDSVLFGSEIMKDGHELKRRLPVDGREGVSLHGILDSYEKMIVSEALEKSKSIRKAAKFLGLSHTALLNKIKKHKIVVTK